MSREIGDWDFEFRRSFFVKRSEDMKNFEMNVLKSCKARYCYKYLYLGSLDLF